MLPTRARNHSSSKSKRDILDDAPVPDVQLELVVHPTNSRPKASTDASGTAAFSLGDATVIHLLQASATRDGFVPLAIRWSRKYPDSVVPPGRLLFQMEKATTISGRVIDQDQNPLTGATVFISASKRYPRSEQWVAVSYEAVTTDAKGRWSFTGVPERPDAISLAAHHPLCLSERASFELTEFTPLSALRDGSAVLKLERGTRIEGTVLGPDHRPVPNAEIFYAEGRRFGNAIPAMKADSHGRFILGIKPGTVTSVTAHSPGFGPVGQAIRVAAEPQQITLTLPPAQKIGGRVVDRAGRPIAGADLSLGWSPVRRETSGRGSEAVALRALHRRGRPIRLERRPRQWSSRGGVCRWLLGARRPAVCRGREPYCADTCNQDQRHCHRQRDRPDHS